MAVSLALFTLNFLNLDEHGRTADDRHCSEPNRPREMIKWKDVLTGKWRGPDPILIRSRGAICVFPQEEDNPFWILEHLTRRIQLLDNESQEQDPKISMDHTPHAGHSGS